MGPRDLIAFACLIAKGREGLGRDREAQCPGSLCLASLTYLFLQAVNVMAE